MGPKHSNMKELRADTKALVLRIAFAFDPNRSAILLVEATRPFLARSAFTQGADRQG